MILPLIKTCSLIHTLMSTGMNCPGPLHLGGKEDLQAHLNLLEKMLLLDPAHLDMVR